ncbi:hypothetical protein FRC06_009774 [Ceratobasidium sp. 370]|nr:hypothetical protein FRC06_009774 [Ceratobasidium sp. 370]
MVKGLESPFLNSPVPHDSPTFPPAIHKRQSVSIPSVGGLPLVGSMPDAVPGMVVSGAVPLTGLPSTLGPNGFPISVPNLDTLPLRNLGGTGVLPSTTPLGSVSSLPGTAGISVPDVPNVDGLPLVGGVGGMVSSVSNGLGLNGLPLSGVPSQLGTVGQVLGPVTYPLAVLGENPYAVHGLTDPASKLLAELSPHHLQQTGSSVVESGSGRLVQGVQGVVPGVGAVEPVAGLAPAPAPGTGPSSVSLPGAVSGVNLPGGVPGTNLPSGIPGLGPLPSVGTLPVSSILPVFGSTPPLVPTVNQLNQAATVPGVLPNPLAAVPGVVPIPTGNGVLGGQSVGLGGVAGTAPGLVPSVGTLPVSVPVPVPGVDSLLVPSSGQLGPAAAPFAAIPGSLGPVSQGVDVPVVSEVVGANGAIPGLVGVVPGIVPASVSAPGLIPTSASVPSLIPASASAPSLTGTLFPELLPTKGDLGVPVVDSPSAVTDKDVVGVYKATGGMGAMGQPDEEVQVNGWKDGNGTGKDGKEVEMKEKYVDGNDGQGKTTSEASSSTVKMADPPHTLSTTRSGTHSWATPTTAASLAPSGTMAWPKDGTPVRSALVTESPSTRPQMVKQATPMPVAESLTAWAGLGRRASPVPDAVPTSFSIGVPPAHATAAPLSITTSSTSAPPSPVDNSNSSASPGSDDRSALPTTIVAGSTHPVPMYHGGSPLSRAPEISPGRLAPTVDATGTMMDALPSMSGTVNPTESLRRGVGPPKMTTSVMRAATPTASAPAHGQTN